MIALLWPLLLGVILPWALMMIADAIYSIAEEIDQ